MKKAFILFVALFAATVCHAQSADSTAFASAQWKKTRLRGGITAMTAQVEIFSSRQYISVVRYNPRRHAARIVQPAKLETVTAMAADAGAAAAVNAGFWNIKTDIPTTYARIDGSDCRYVKREGMEYINGIVAIDARHRLHVFECDTAQYGKYAGGYDNILASGPVLVDDGKAFDYTERKSYFYQRHPRTVIGTTRRGKIFMVVVDGRAEESAGLTIDELVTVCRWMGLHDAINLDGGGSSTLWTAGQGVLNHPSDNGRFDHEGLRKVSSSIVVLP